MTKKIQAELIWSGLLLILAFVGLVWLVPDYIKMPSKLDNPFLSPRLWPTIIFYLIAVLGLGMMGKTFILARKTEPTETDSVKNNSDNKKMTRQTLSVLACLACMIMCIALIDLLGMPLSVSFCLSALFWLSGKKAPLIGILWLIALPFLLYLFFFYVADVSIPLGILE